MKSAKVLLVMMLALAFVLSGCAQPAQQPNEQTPDPAANYPNKPIQLVIPYAPGGATDIIYRIIAEYAQAELGQPIAVVNMAGASATIGSRHVKDAAPDGYTSCIHDVIATGLLFRCGDYAFEAFEPVLFAPPQRPTLPLPTLKPVQGMDELLEDAAEKPGEIVWSVTLGSTDHFFFMGMMNACRSSHREPRLAAMMALARRSQRCWGTHPGVH